MDLLTKYSVSPDALGFEILEEALLDVGRGQGDRRSACGAWVSPYALDNFGAGYSNLSWLKDLPGSPG